MPSISVGIPIYNEAANIQTLLQNVIDDCVTAPYTLTELIIYDDCSTDDTVHVVHQFIDEYTGSISISLEAATVNKGKAAGLQHIFENATGDYLVTLDSDVRLESGKSTIESIVVQMRDEQAGIASGWSYYTAPTTMFSRAFSFSLSLLRTLGKQKPFYRCWGGLMAFERSLYTSIRLPESLYRIDGYLYMLAIQNGYSYSFFEQTLVPDDKDFSQFTIQKYAKIQARSNSFPDHFDTNFAKQLVTQEIEISMVDKLGVLMTAASRHPLNFAAYIYVRFRSRILTSNTAQSNKVLWRD